MSADLHIAINSEVIAKILGFEVRTSALTSVIVTAMIVLGAFAINRLLKKTSKPKGVQAIIEVVIESLHGMVQDVTGDTKKTKDFFPFIASFFIFVIFNNWFGLLPIVGPLGYYAKEAAHTTQAEVTTEQLEHGEEPAHAEEAVEKKSPFIPYLRPATSDLNVTLALGLMSIGLVQWFGIKYLGLAYFRKFFNFSSPILFFVGLLELISEFAKIISFAFRLFGNIFAGKVLIIVIKFLVPLILPMPFYALEVFIGFIQALVFSMLTLVFINMATVSHEEH